MLRGSGRLVDEIHAERIIVGHAEPLLSHEPGAPIWRPEAPFTGALLRFIPDLGFPAAREEILACAVEHGAPASILRVIRQLPPVVGAARDLPEVPPADVAVFPRPARGSSNAL
jgi:hypothetical protein